MYHSLISLVKSAHQKKSDELLTILQSLHDRLDRIPKPSELPEDSKYSPREFYTEFGSWDKALEAAGIDKEQALLDVFRQVADKVEHVPIGE